MKKYIYAIHAPSVGRVKIGTSVNPYERLRGLQCACPVELVLAGCREGTYAEEREIHLKHARLRRIGEWFDDSILKHLDLDVEPPPAKERTNGAGGVRGRSQRGVSRGSRMVKTETEFDREKLEEKRKKLIALGLEFFAEHGRPPTARDWKKVSGTKWPSYLTCIRAFGSWDDYLMACGWEPRGRGRPPNA